MYNQMVSDNVARVFSTSWSCTEIYGCNTSEMSSRDAIFSEMAGQGWTLVAASGDRGATTTARIWRSAFRPRTRTWSARAGPS
jgi:subtilase family serine protease